MAVGGDMAWYDSDGITVLSTEKVLEIILAGATDTPRKFGLRSVGTAAVGPLRIAIDQEGDSDGYLMLRIGLDAGGSLGSPTGLLVSVGPSGMGGAWPAAATWFWAVSALSATGETAESFLVPGNVTATTCKPTVTWDAVPGSTGYRLYRTLDSTTWPVNSLVASLAAGITTYADAGAAPGPGSPPEANTSGGGPPAYGTPPTLGVDPVVTPVLPVGAWAWVWVSRVVPSYTPPQTNPRRAALAVTEVAP
jgi:hypothetical protein